MTRDNNYPCGEEILIDNKYLRVGKLINQGTDGRIYAVHSNDGVNSAVVKYFDCMYGDKLYQNALLEIEAAQRLAKCPYTVDMLGYCVRADSVGRADVFIMMNRLKCCEQLQLDTDEILQMGSDICLALEFIKRKGLIHCDVKPSNIFLNNSGVWQIGDFGCIQRKGKCLRLGSPAYCSPEAVYGERCDIRSDIYSLGIVMYKLLSGGRFPFCPERADLMQQYEVERTIERRMNGEPIPPLESLNSEINEILHTMCEFEPQKRFNSPISLSKRLKLSKTALNRK